MSNRKHYLPNADGVVPHIKLTQLLGTHASGVSCVISEMRTAIRASLNKYEKEMFRKYEKRINNLIDDLNLSRRQHREDRSLHSNFLNELESAVNSGASIENIKERIRRFQYREVMLKSVLNSPFPD